MSLNHKHTEYKPDRPWLGPLAFAVFLLVVAGVVDHFSFHFFGGFF